MKETAIEHIDKQVTGGNSVAMPMRAWRAIVSQDLELRRTLNKIKNGCRAAIEANKTLGVQNNAMDFVLSSIELDCERALNNETL